MRKKGLSNVEVVLSFVIFIGFVFFLFYFLNPFKKTALGSSILDSVEYNIKKEISTFLLTETINLKNVQASCFDIDKAADKNISARNNERQVKAEISGNKALIENSGSFYTLYYSDDVDILSGLSGCAELTSENYSLGIIKEYQIVSIKKILELNQTYETNYTNLKEKIKLPGENDFSLAISTMIGEKIILLDKNVPKGIDVLARDSDIKILKPDGEIINAVLNIKVW